MDNRTGMEEKFPPQYNSRTVESGLYESWEEKGYFGAGGQRAGGKKYVIVIPPPNITGFLHMGHALNNTIQDILIRWKRMMGFNALWVPGTDHAGIATQNVVERMLSEKNLDRKSLGREKFVEEVWKWKDEYGSRIIFQLKRLGASCDWSRQRFTMDEGLSRAVKEAFVLLYDRGLIYKGKRIINWCCRCGTALSDEEVEYSDENSFLYYLRYPLVDGGFVEVATTRPETMLGDTAVAVNPADRRYRKISGARVKLPFVDRIIPVITDASVEKDFGTGAVKVTPSHDPADFEMGKRHDLPSVTVMTEEGVMNENAGMFKGLDRFRCREEVIKELEKAKLLAKTEPYANRVGRCYRCDSVVEPYLSSQWFVRMSPLAKPAIKVAEENLLKFYPERWKKVYLNWLYNIRDWCISRQIWWGHRIPVWYCRDCSAKNAEGGENAGVFVSVGSPVSCPKCGGTDIFQDSDVLDTWFSSWLWPFSVFGWPEKTEDLEIYYPTDTLVTAQEILFFWVARMVMAGNEFMGKTPFENIFIHGTVRDKKGRKMSKSLGNAIDPVKIIDDHGADSLRFSLISMTAFGQDVFLSPTFHIKGRNFMNKVWNASRFIIRVTDDSGIPEVKLPRDVKDFQFPELWIVSKLEEVTENVTTSLESFRMNEALNSLYDFFWHDFCDWYLEIAKVEREESDEYFRSSVLPVLFHVHLSVMKMLHPFIPFITEKIWQIFAGYCAMEAESIVVSNWPVPGTLCKASDAGRQRRKIEDIMEVVTTIRDVKTRFGIPVVKPIDCLFEKKPAGLEAAIISRLAGVGNMFPYDGKAGGPNILVRNLKQGRLGMSFEGIIDISKEIDKLRKERDRMKGYLVKIDGRLGSEEFIEKAPAEVKEKEREKKRQIEESLRNLEKDLDFLQEKGEKNGSIC